MLQDIRALHAEVQLFRQKLKDLPDLQVQNIGAFARRVEKELSNLEVAEPHDHIQASTNTSDLVRIWRLARSLPALSGFSIRFRTPTRTKEDTVTVDLVYRKGHAWMIRSSLKYRALVTEITNLPFIESSVPYKSMRSDASSVPNLDRHDSYISIASDTTDGELFSAINLDQLKIIDIAQKMVIAANHNLKLGAIPKITMYFPRILEDLRSEDDVQNIKALFDHLSSHYDVCCVTQISTPLAFELNVGLRVKDEFGNDSVQLAVAEPVQLDLTTLFVLCSDVSNVPLSSLTESHLALHFQIQEESMVPCLKDRLFSIIRGSRSLFCTPLAQRRFFEIVEELGSVYERERAALMFSRHPADILCRRLSQISIHEWPNDIRLPIVAHKFDNSSHQDTIPFATEFKTEIAQDCFESAWYGRIFTLSANQQAVKLFREALFNWPDNCVPRPTVHLHAARSLNLYERPGIKAGMDIDDMQT